MADIAILRALTDKALSMLAALTPCSDLLAEPGAAEQLATSTTLPSAMPSMSAAELSCPASQGSKLACGPTLTPACVAGGTRR